MTLADLIPSLRTSLSSRLAPGLWPETARATCDGQLLVGGVDLAQLAAQFGTPVLAIDATDVRSRCRAYRESLPGVEIAYAAKAFLCRAMARLVDQEGLAMDVCSGGEVAVAAAAGFPGARMVMHGNVKTVEDLKTAMATGVGRIVIDSLEEIAPLAALVPTRQQVLLRVVPGSTPARTPGSPPAPRTRSSGSPSRPVPRRRPCVACSPGPSWSWSACTATSAPRCARSAGTSRHRSAWSPFSPRSRASTASSCRSWTSAAATRWRTRPGRSRWTSPRSGAPCRPRWPAACQWHGLRMPRLTVEPGRALIARAGVTVYRVAAVKHGVHRTFVAVDGGMSDNPRPALYGARYHVRRFGRPERVRLAPVTVVGRHCESSRRARRGVDAPRGHRCR